MPDDPPELRLSPACRRYNGTDCMADVEAAASEGGELMRCDRLMSLVCLLPVLLR